MSDGSRKAVSKTPFHFVAGLGSGICSAVLLQPIDLLKTRVQQSGHHSLREAFADIRRHASIIASAQAGGSGAPPASGIGSSIAAHWRGTVPSALRTGFGSAVYFTSLNAIRQSAARIPFLAATADDASRAVRPSRAAAAATPTPAAPPSPPLPLPSSPSSSSSSSSSSLPKLSNTGNLLAGATARGFAGFLLMPLTVIKVRYESNLYSYSSIASAARGIYRGEGARGFFAGFGATAIRDAPYAGLYVLFYEQSKKRLSRLYGSESGGGGRRGGNNNNNTTTNTMGMSRAAMINFASGISGGVVCSVISNPFDAVKTRIQLQPGRYRNMAQAARKMLAEEGFRSLWDGLALRMSRKAISSALAWTLYEEFIRRAEATWSSRAATNGNVL